MAKESPSTTYSNLRDAYCAHHRCKPQDFERRVFWATLQRFRWPFALVFMTFQRRIFSMDLETIRAVGQASRRTEVGTILEEFQNYNRLDRSRRRGYFGIRVSGTRLLELFRRYEPRIKPPAMMDPLEGVSPLTSSQAINSTSTNPASVRRIRQVMTGLVAGASFDSLLLEVGWTEDQLIEALQAAHPEHPGFLWMRDQLILRRKLAMVEQEAFELRRAIADQSRELSRLRGGTDLPA